MQRLLALVVTLHWTAVFAVLTGLCAFGDGDSNQIAPIFASAPARTGIGILSEPLRLALTILFALCVALFAWSVVTALSSGKDAATAQSEVQDKAFAMGSVAMTALLIVSAIQPGGLGISGVAIVYAALIISFVALRVERPVAPEEPKSDVVLALKAQALDATFGSLAARLSTKPTSDMPETR